MMNIVNIYKRYLPSMKNKKIKYNLIESKYNNKTGFGIQIVVQSDDFDEEKTLEHISSSEKFARNIIDILYDNSVDTIHFKDIVEDYIFDSECV